jgi:hypothetical protein
MPKNKKKIRGIIIDEYETLLITLREGSAVSYINKVEKRIDKIRKKYPKIEKWRKSN